MTPYIEWVGTTAQGLRTGTLRLLDDGQAPGGTYRFACGATELRIISFHGATDFLPSRPGEPNHPGEQRAGALEIRRFLRRAGYAGALWERHKPGLRQVYVPVDLRSQRNLLIFN